MLRAAALERRILEGEPMFTVILACVHNAGRSRIAEAFFNHLADPSKAVMREVGIDLSDARPQKLTEKLAGEAQLLVTMGCGDDCPYVPGLRRDDWPLRDPKGLSMDEVRTIRDEIRQRVESMLAAPLLVSGTLK